MIAKKSRDRVFKSPPRQNYADAMANELIVFDVDGVIRDSSMAAYESMKHGLDAVGLKHNFGQDEMWRLRGLGKYNERKNCIKALISASREKADLKLMLSRDDAEIVIDSLVERNIGEAETELADGVSNAFAGFFLSDRAAELISLLPGVEDTLKRLKEKGYTLAIFTNSGIASIRRDLAGMDLSIFSSILSEEDVKAKKPSGEGIVKTMETLGFGPKRTYYVGDAISDIQAAREAGCIAVSVLSGMGSMPQLEKARPDLIFKDISAVGDYFIRRARKKR